MPLFELARVALFIWIAVGVVLGLLAGRITKEDEESNDE